MRRKAIINGVILSPQEEIRGKALLFDQRVLQLSDRDQLGDAEIIDAAGAWVLPGLIDLHIHGFRGDDASDGSPKGLRRIAKALPDNGVTAFLPTTMTLPWPDIERALQAIRQVMAESLDPAFKGAQVLGCHLEGPFINPIRKGAQLAEHIRAPQAEPLIPYLDVIRLLTLAPEMPGALDTIRALKAMSPLTIAMGHSDASYEQAMAAIEAGLSHATHLFNAMPPMLHRAPGAVGAALSAPITCELIADTFHVHPGLFPLLHKAKSDRLVLVSDCTRAGGLPDGEYSLGGQPIWVRGRECRLKDGTVAGSVLKLYEGLRHYHEHGRMPLMEAVRAATLNPAEAIGIADCKGSLEPGKDADILLLDTNLEPIATYVRGRCVYRRGD